MAEIPVERLLSDRVCDQILTELVRIAGDDPHYTSDKVPFARWDMKRALINALGLEQPLQADVSARIEELRDVLQAEDAEIRRLFLRDALRQLGRANEQIIGTPWWDGAIAEVGASTEELLDYISAPGDTFAGEPLEPGTRVKWDAIGRTFYPAGTQ